MAMMSVVASATTKPQACLGGVPPRARHYRRSTTTKAPRKRTFIASMSKYNTADVPSASSAAAGDAQQALAASMVCSYNGGDDTGAGNGGRNSGGRGNSGNSNNFNNGPSRPDNGPRSLASLLPGAFGLAAMILAASAFAPSDDRSGLAIASLLPLGVMTGTLAATAGNGGSGSGIGGAEAAALAVGAAAAAATSLAVAAATERIVYGRIALTADERLMLSSSVRVIRV